VLLPLILWLAPVDLRWPFVVATLALFPMTIEAVYTHAVHGAQRYDLTTQVSTIKMTLHLLASVVAVAMGAGILGLVVGLTLGSLIACALQRSRVRALYPAAAAPVSPAARIEMRAYLVPLSVASVLDTIVWDRSEVFFLRLYTSSEAIAFYSLAFGLATKAMLVPEIVVGALLPAFSALHGGGAPGEFNRVYRTAVRYVALAAAPIAAVTTAVAPGIVTLLYGGDYLPAAHLLGALTWLALVSALRKVAWTALRAVGDRRAVLNATWVSAAVNVAAAAWLIPRYGTTGAVLANGSAQILAAVWGFTAMARGHGTTFPAIDVAKTTGAAVLALAASLAVAAGGHDAARLGAAVAAGLAVYGVAAVVTGLVGPREWGLLRSSTRRIVAPRAAGG
jgi:O-antigen/teichoic acid export membrane protein